MVAAATPSATPNCTATLANGANAAYSVSCTTPSLPVTAPATIAFKWEKVTDADNSITGFSDDTAASGTVTGTATSGADKIKGTVTYDEDGAGAAKAPTSAVFEVTAS